MPELPEVEVVCRGLRDLLLGEHVEHCDFYVTKLRIPVPKTMGALLNNKRLSSIQRRAKYIILHFDNQYAVVIHLGMSGTLNLHDEPYQRIKHDHFIIRFACGKTLVLNDPRRFGLVKLVEDVSYERDKLFRNLGVEPLSPPFNIDLVRAYFASHPHQNIKQVLLSQTLVVGVGNIYANEVLFCAGIHPLETLEKITPQQQQKLISCIRKTMLLAIEKGGASLKNFKNIEGNLGGFLPLAKVYGKAGHRCPRKACTAIIQKQMQQGRASFFCPNCQRLV